jgi:hypothetical protein
MLQPRALMISLLVSVASPAVARAQPGFPHGDLVRVSDLDHACSQPIGEAGQQCRQAIVIASGKASVATETRSPDGTVTHQWRPQIPDASKVGWLGEEACENRHWDSCMLYTMLLERGDVAGQSCDARPGAAIAAAQAHGSSRSAFGRR